MTIPKMLKAAVSTYGDKVWMRKKRAGLWHEYSWRDSYDRVRYFSLGLISLGFGPGQALCITSDSDPQWFWAEIAAQAAGGSVVGLNRGRPAEELKAVIRQFGVKFVAAQDREQVDKLLEIKGDVPSLLKVIYWNAKGVETYQDPLLASFDEVAELGRRLNASQSGMFEDKMARIKRADSAITQCGSIDGSVVHSTTLTHDNLLTAIEGFRSVDPFNTSDRWFSYILPEGTVEQVMGLTGSLTGGMCIDFPENQETAQQDLREVGSTIVCYPSAFWEGLAAMVKDRIEKTTFVKRTISKMAASVGSRMADAKFGGRKPGVFLKAAGALAEFAFFRPLKARIGLANTRCVYAFGAELTPMAFKEMANMGLNVRQLDVSGGIVMVRRRDGGAKVESVGKV